MTLSIVILGAACSEKLDSSAGCPLLCVDPANRIQTITLDAAVGLDTTVLASGGVGLEPLMLLASRGDTLDTRIIVRYDTIAATIASTGATITTIDSATLQFHFDSLAKNVAVPVTISVYDVDTVGVSNSVGIGDTAVAVLAPRFTSARLIGSRRLNPGKAVDTVSVPISNAFVLDRVRTGKRLRVGVRVTADGGASVTLRQPSAEASASAITLRMRVSSNFSIPAVTQAPISRVVAKNFTDAIALRDFMIVVRGTPLSAGSMLAVGGVPATRSYLRFAIPAQLIDSSVIVRASLLLTQVPSGSLDAADTAIVRPFIVVAGAPVLDPGRAAKITSSLVSFDSLSTFPSSSGVKEIQIVPAFSVWAAQQEILLPRAIVLQSSKEGVSPQRTLFYSSEAADTAVRPKLRVSFTSRARVGTP